MEIKKQKIVSIILVIIILIVAYVITDLNTDNNINVTRIDVGEVPLDFILTEESDLQIIYFNVGDADCILIKDDNDVMLIDSGEEADGKYIAEYLKRLGITKISYLIGTHEHEDHIGGMNHVIDSFDIDNIYLPEIKNENSKQYIEVLESANKKGYKVEPKCPYTNLNIFCRRVHSMYEIESLVLQLGFFLLLFALKLGI